MSQRQAISTGLKTHGERPEGAGSERCHDNIQARQPMES